MYRSRARTLADCPGRIRQRGWGKLFGLVWSQAFSRGLAEGWLTAHPYEVQKSGLAGLESGLKGLKDGTVRAKKILVRPGETEGAKPRVLESEAPIGELYSLVEPNHASHLTLRALVRTSMP